MPFNALAALSLGGSGPAQSVRADTLARGPSHSQGVSIPSYWNSPCRQRTAVPASNTAPWHQAEYTFLESGTWHQPDLCSSHNNAFAESLTPTAQCANPQSQCPGWQPSTYFVTRRAALPTPAITPLCPAGFPGVGAPSRSGHWSHSPFTDNDNDGPQEENEDGKATCTDAQNEPHLLRSLGHFEGSLALLARSWGEQRGQRSKGAKVTQARI